MRHRLPVKETQVPLPTAESSKTEESENPMEKSVRSATQAVIGEPPTRTQAQATVTKVETAINSAAESKQPTSLSPVRSLTRCTNYPELLDWN